MSEPIKGLWAVYITDYPDEGAALIEAKDAKSAIRIAREGPWEAEPANALSAQEMTPEAMATRIANEEADASGTIEGQWLANVACGQALEIERVRACLSRQVEGLWDLAEALAHELGRSIEGRLTLELSNASLARERDLAIEAHHNATAERDAAREKATLDEQALDEAIRRGEENTARAGAERDAAREEAERLRRLLPKVRANLNGAMGRELPDPTTRAYLGAALSLLTEDNHADE